MVTKSDCSCVFDAAAGVVVAVLVRFRLEAPLAPLLMRRLREFRLVGREEVDEALLGLGLGLICETI